MLPPSWAPGPNLRQPSGQSSWGQGEAAEALVTEEQGWGLPQWAAPALKDPTSSRDELVPSHYR